jgi:soluble lytic murein transglycosylase
MIVPLALALALVADPRSSLVELQVQGRQQEALARVDRELAEHPAQAYAWGLDYLRGHLLIRLGRRDEAVEAFNAALGNTPRLAFYAYYHFALAQERAGHPEVAAGLIATAIKNEPAPPLIGDAVVLLARTLERGGDCRVLQGVAPEKIPAPARRRLLVAQADCAERAGQREFARNLLLSLLEEDRKDEAARLAAERLLSLASPGEHGRLKGLVGLTLVQHRDFARAIPVLVAGLDGNESEREAFELHYAIARAHFWQGHFARAAVLFNDLATASRNGNERAAALYQRGRSYELLGHWQTAAAAFRRAYLASPAGEWAAAAVFSALRLEWRSGEEAKAAELYQLMSVHPAWRAQTSRAALFLAASDIVRGRGERAGAWLDRAGVFGGKDDQLEVAYWRGRLAELKGETRSAIGQYLIVARADLIHPLAQSAVARLAAPPLARAAAAEGKRLASSSRPEDLLGAWILLGGREGGGTAAWRRLREALGTERGAAPYLRLSQVPTERWPLWHASLDQPPEMLLALGLFREGAPAVREEFPLRDPSLGFTGAVLLAAAGETSRALGLAETIRFRAPDRLPLAMQPSAFQTLLYPLPFREVIERQASLRGLDPHLLAAAIREESRFDPLALSPAAARGLAQFILPTARVLAGGLQLGTLSPEDLYRPEVSIALGADYLARLLKSSGGAVHLAVTAYNAGEAEVRLWRSYCYSEEREEFFTKVAFEETRTYLRRVLASQVEYARLYP